MAKRFTFSLALVIIVSMSAYPLSAYAQGWSEGCKKIAMTFFGSIATEAGKQVARKFFDYINRTPSAQDEIAGMCMTEYGYCNLNVIAPKDIDCYCVSTCDQPIFGVTQ